jgi:hypothetical protein
MAGETTGSGGAAAARRARLVRVFVSSTFRDFADERDLLAKRVFPELQRRARTRSVDVVCVDLRWGITQEEAERGETLPACLREIERSRPYFLCLLGERYGWTPPEGAYPETLVESQPWLREHRGGASVTELEVLHGVLNDPASAGHALFWLRDARWSAGRGPDFESTDPGERERLADLKRRIAASGFPTRDYGTPEEFADRVTEELWGLIDSDYPDVPAPDPESTERRLHEAYADERLRIFVGQEATLAELAGLLDGTDARAQGPGGRSILLSGPSGLGKSALVAMALRRHREAAPRDIVFEHYIGCAPTASAPKHIVERLESLAGTTLAGSEDESESDEQARLRRRAADALKALARRAREAGGRVVIALDAVDRLTEPNSLAWMPTRLPEGTVILCSSTGHRVGGIVPTNVRAQKLDEGAARACIDALLAVRGRRLTGPQVQRILAHPCGRSPLFLWTMIDELCMVPRHDLLPARIEACAAVADEAGLLDLRLARIEEDHGAEVVARVLEALALSTHGMTEDELRDYAGCSLLALARLRLALGGMLSERGALLRLSHALAEAAVRRRYLFGSWIHEFPGDVPPLDWQETWCWNQVQVRFRPEAANAVTVDYATLRITHDEGLMGAFEGAVRDNATVQTSTGDGDPKVLVDLERSDAIRLAKVLLQHPLVDSVRAVALSDLRDERAKGESEAAQRLVQWWTSGRETRRRWAELPLLLLRAARWRRTSDLMASVDPYVDLDFGGIEALHDLWHKLTYSGLDVEDPATRIAESIYSGSISLDRMSSAGHAFMCLELADRGQWTDIADDCMDRALNGKITFEVRARLLANRSMRWREQAAAADTDAERVACIEGWLAAVREARAIREAAGADATLLRIEEATAMARLEGASPDAADAAAIRVLEDSEDGDIDTRVFRDVARSLREDHEGGKLWERLQWWRRTRLPIIQTAEGIADIQVRFVMLCERRGAATCLFTGDAYANAVEALIRGDRRADAVQLSERYGRMARLEEPAPHLSLLGSEDLWLDYGITVPRQLESYRGILDALGQHEQVLQICRWIRAGNARAVDRLPPEVHAKLQPNAAAEAHDELMSMVPEWEALARHRIAPSESTAAAIEALVPDLSNTFGFYPKSNQLLSFARDAWDEVGQLEGRIRIRRRRLELWRARGDRKDLLEWRSAAHTAGTLAMLILEDGNHREALEIVRSMESEASAAVPRCDAHAHAMFCRGVVEARLLMPSGIDALRTAIDMELRNPSDAAESDRARWPAILATMQAKIRSIRCRRILSAIAAAALVVPLARATAPWLAVVACSAIAGFGDLCWRWMSRGPIYGMWACLGFAVRLLVVTLAWLGGGWQLGLGFLAVEAASHGIAARMLSPREPARPE